MAELLKKFKCKTTTGEIQELSVYTTLVEATNEGEARQVKVEVEPGNFMTGYIGLTKDIDTPKASAINFKNGEEHWKMRKYMGLKNMANYMSKTYPDTYQTITELPDDFPDTSDATNLTQGFYGCTNLLEADINISKNCTSLYGCFWLDSNLENISGNWDTSKCASFNYFCSATPKLKYVPVLDFESATRAENMFTSSGIIEFNAVNTSKITSYSKMFSNCQKLTKTTGIDTSSCTDFLEMHYNNMSLIETPPFDLSSMTLETITDGKSMKWMLLNCNSLPSATFNNVPQGVTEEQLRTATSAPSTCQIIINYREEV